MDKKMYREIDYIMSLLNRSINKDQVEKTTLDQEVDFSKIYTYARYNNIVGVLSPIVLNDFKGKIEETIYKQWREITTVTTVMEYRNYMGLRSVLKEAEIKNLELVVFKGPILADLYPQYALRNSSDTDIYVDEENKEEALALLTSIGYEKDEDNSKDEVPVFIHPQYKHMIELHYFLWEDYEGYKIDILKSLDLTNRDKRINIQACGMNIRTFGHEEHLIYQMFHIIKHFTMQAVSIRYLSDISVFINAYGKYINYDSFWEKMEVLGYEKFCQIFFSICVKMLDMDGEILEGRHDFKEEAMYMLLADMVTMGMLFEEKTASWQILGIMRPYLVGNEAVPEKKRTRMFKVLFPSSKSLPMEYKYAKKHPILLPIAWVHKFFKFTFMYMKIKRTHGDWYSANEKLETAEYRLNLVRELGLSAKKSR